MKYHLRSWRLGLLALGVLLLGSPLQARLGESREKIEGRFGEPVRQNVVQQLGLTQWTYANKDLRIGVIYHEGVSVAEQYVRVSSERPEDETALPIPAVLADSIIQAQAGGYAWEAMESPSPAHDLFQRSDKQAVAAFSKQQDVIAAVLVVRQDFFRRLMGLE